ncbi:hypothetical protein WR25_21184 [Diploscapter pachys]|uniref:Uncharacterized protein n=1 Tax=Diploscapter pachys TaxID=2018661 RepID=A0A2A2LCW8_9BILA|nr:hypothetical protein WR25_21184 [Diploscapter pachys]
MLRVVGKLTAPSLVDDRLKALQEQLLSLEKELAPAKDKKPNQQVSVLDESGAWQPQKRLVAWQPMKRSQVYEDDKVALIHAIEARLQEVLRAGERLGVSADEVLRDIRYRNQQAASN